MYANYSQNPPQVQTIKGDKNIPHVSSQSKLSFGLKEEKKTEKKPVVMDANSFFSSTVASSVKKSFLKGEDAHVATGSQHVSFATTKTPTTTSTDNSRTDPSLEATDDNLARKRKRQEEDDASLALALSLRDEELEKNHQLAEKEAKPTAILSPPVPVKKVSTSGSSAWGVGPNSGSTQKEAPKGFENMDVEADAEEARGSQVSSPPTKKLKGGDGQAIDTASVKLREAPKPKAKWFPGKGESQPMAPGSKPVPEGIYIKADRHTVTCIHT